jgi:hypothetical protein
VTSAIGAGFTALMPLVARGRLDASSGGFGVLSAAVGVGSVAAVWSLPRLRGAQRPERAVAVAALAWSLGVATFAVGRSWELALVAVVLAGAGTMGTLSVLFTNYTLQLEEWMRGRGSALAMLMVWLGASVGALLWGALASTIGVSSALVATAALNAAWIVVGRLSLPISPELADQAG